MFIYANSERGALSDVGIGLIDLTWMHILSDGILKMPALATKLSPLWALSQAERVCLYDTTVLRPYLTIF